MKCVSHRGHIVLGVLTLLCVALTWPASGQAPPGGTGGNILSIPRLNEVHDSNLVNCPGIRETYFLRYPFAKRAFDRDLKEKYDPPKPNDHDSVMLGNNHSADNVLGHDTTIEIKLGESQMKQAMNPQVGDAKAPGRPAYWPLLVPCGSPTGYFLPPTPAVITSSSSLPLKTSNPVPVNYSHLNPPPCYVQPYLFDTNKGNKHGTKTGVASARDEELWDYELTTFGVGPISDTQFQIIDREDNQRFLELLYDPERWMWMGQAMGTVQRQGASNSMAGAAESNFAAAVDSIEANLPNVANEEAAQKVTTSSIPNKSIPQVIYMVQQCYKNIYIPMAILLLLPGALLTQMKGMVKFGFLGGKDEDSVSPFSGILRAIIAIFLIPATQLIVSYCIDIGNSMAHEVRQYVRNEDLFRWSHEQTYNPPVKNASNVLSPFAAQGSGDGGGTGGGAGGGGGTGSGTGASSPQSASSGGLLGAILGNILGGYFDDLFPEFSSPELRKEQAPDWRGGVVSMPQTGIKGKGSSEALEERSQVEQQTDLSQIIHLGFNVLNFLMGSALVVLCQFQFVILCYLFLLGPIAAALFAWPAGIGSGSGVSGGLFKAVFANWLDGITILCLWRFWWMVVLACMCTRIEFLIEVGSFAPNSQWEAYMYTCFMGLLMYVPFQPFEFKPGEAATQALEKSANAAHSTSSGGQGGAGGGQGSASSSQSTQSITTAVHSTTAQGGATLGETAVAGGGGSFSDAPPTSDGSSSSAPPTAQGITNEGPGSAALAVGSAGAVAGVSAGSGPPQASPQSMVQQVNATTNVVQAPIDRPPTTLAPPSQPTTIVLAAPSGKQEKP